jgi:hypothetical protein
VELAAAAAVAEVRADEAKQNALLARALQRSLLAGPPQVETRRSPCGTCPRLST